MSYGNRNLAPVLRLTKDTRQCILWCCYGDTLGPVSFCFEPNVVVFWHNKDKESSVQNTRNIHVMLGLLYAK